MQETPNSQAVLRKKKGAVGIRFPNLRLYYKAIVINTISLA